MAAAARDGEASGSRRVVTSSAAREAQRRNENRGSAQGDGSGPLELTGCGGVDEERARKGPEWVAALKVKREEIMCVAEWQCVQAVVFACLAHAHASQTRYDGEAEDEGQHGSGVTPPETIVPVPVLPSEVCAKTAPYNAPAAKHGQPRRELSTAR
ncbi:hypothetical protein ERJ75_000873600 [Trypanosoma vivax]|nr:hypothetical protein ERJ75_000873600 [Trypanosoma vivax]